MLLPSFCPRIGIIESHAGSVEAVVAMDHDQHECEHEHFGERVQHVGGWQDTVFRVMGVDAPIM